MTTLDDEFKCEGCGRGGLIRPAQSESGRELCGPCQKKVAQVIVDNATDSDNGD